MGVSTWGLGCGECGAGAGVVGAGLFLVLPAGVNLGLDWGRLLRFTLLVRSERSFEWKVYAERIKLR